MLIMELIAEAKDNPNPLYITFLDSSKSFDMEDQTALVTALYGLSIETNLWQLYKDMYTDVASRVRVIGQLSQCMKMGRGIQKVVNMSSGAYRCL